MRTENHRVNDPYTKKSIVGCKFGRLVVVRRVYPNHRDQIAWLCKCSCGKYIRSTSYFLRAGIVKSCGCFRRDFPRLTKRTHGMTNTPTYGSWSKAKSRIFNKSDPKYSEYGGRGLKFSKRWLKFEVFLQDMGVRPPNTSIDRINNNRGYFPDNCRWASIDQQSSNKSNNMYYLIAGENLIARDWCKRFNVSNQKLVEQRLRAGWSIKKALFTEVGRCPNCGYKPSAKSRKAC